jgi:RNA polymerase sigma-70 factor (ECF subfamily)
MQNESPKHTDAEIIRQVIDGNVNAFESLLIRYEALVLKIAKRHVPSSEVEETAQNAFIRAYQSLPTFKGKGDFKQWLSSIAVRTCYDYWRKAYRSREIPMSSLTEKHNKWLEEVVSDQSEWSLHEKGQREEARELLDLALEKLNPEDRMIIELIYLEGLSGREAADLLGWSIANVKVRSFRSRKKLHKILSELMKG